jgi:hypothetical protein
MNGLIIGYGTATLPQLRRAAAELALLLGTGPDGSHPVAACAPQGIKDQIPLSERTRLTRSP